MHIFLCVLIAIYFILTVGGMMKKRNSSFVFNGSLGKNSSDRIYKCLVKAIADEAKSHGLIGVMAKCRIAERFIDSPSLPLFKQLTAICGTFVSERDCYLETQLIAFFKKRGDLDLGIDKKEVAFDQFLLSERLCRQFNRTLRNRDDADYQRRATLIHKMSRKISQCLGAVPELGDIPFGFGPGANVGVNQFTSVRWKLSADVTMTDGAYSLIKDMPANIHAWPGLLKPKLVSGSYWTSVPKTSLTDRGINVEPILNSYLQKGYGSVIRERLKNVGVDLTDQTVNQRLARVGSMDGSLATIDLSMASDMIAYNLVLDLLPIDWFTVLDCVRSPVVLLRKQGPNTGDQYAILEKFSSMGNGATFELESLIFWSLLSVCCPTGTISVYGDDLICPVEYYDEVLDALTLCGFIPNSDKSFKEGSFRESCGKDYWEGTDVRPVFIKEQLSVKELFRLHNFLVRTGRLADLPSSLLKFIPREHHRFGPDGLGDGHLLWSEQERPTRDKRGWEPYWKVKTWIAKPRVVRQPLSSDYGAFLYSSERRKPDGEDIERTMYDVRSSSPSYKLVTLRTPWRSGYLAKTLSS